MINETQFKSVLLFLADGARPDVMRRLLSAGDLPNISRYLIEKGEMVDGTTVFPSTTGPAYLPFVTGCYPGSCNIPGIRWFDKNEFGKRNIFSVNKFRSYVGWESFLFNRDIGSEIKTVFDLESDAYSIQSLVTRGAGFRDLNRYRRPVQALRAHFTDNWWRFDRDVGNAVLSLLPKKPRFLFAAFPAIDEYSHLFHPEHDLTIEAYKSFDAFIGEVVLRLKRLGLFDSTFITITSDHGLTKTNEHFCLVNFLEKEGFKTFHYPKIYRSGCDAAVMQSGNGMAHIYLKNKDGWRGRKTYESILNGGQWGIVEKLFSQRAIEWVACKNEDGEILLSNSGGRGYLAFSGGNFCYRVEGKDPLDFVNLRRDSSAVQPVLSIEALPQNDGEEILRSAQNDGEEILRSAQNDGEEILRSAQNDGEDVRDGVLFRHSERSEESLMLNDRESLEYSIARSFPDAFAQLWQIFKSGRSGDLIVTAKDGYDLRDKYETPEHHASHGSLSFLHMKVPIIFSNRLNLTESVRTVDLFPTFLDLLGLKNIDNLDGISLSQESRKSDASY